VTPRERYMKRLLTSAVAAVALAVLIGCGEKSSPTPKLADPNDPKLKQLNPVAPGAGKAAPSTQ
jgi:hypothetical protein